MEPVQWMFVGMGTFVEVVIVWVWIVTPKRGTQPHEAPSLPAQRRG